MIVVPVNFNKEHKAMLGHCKMILENEGGRVAINPEFDKLITSLRTAVDKDGIWTKNQSTSYNDIFDAFRLAKFYQFQEKYSKVTSYFKHCAIIVSLTSLNLCFVYYIKWCLSSTSKMLKTTSLDYF